MSGVSNAAVAAVIADVGPQFLADAVTRSVEMWTLIDSADPSDPKGPRWQVKTAGNTSGGQYTPGGTLPTPGAAEFDQAAMNWAKFVAIVSFNTFQLAQLKLASMNPASVLVDQVFEQLGDQAQSIIAAMNTQLISGTDTTDGIIGICTAIDDAGTYAGIDRAANPEFACYIAHNSGTPRALTVAIMDTAYDYFVNTIKKNPGRWVILTGSAQASVMRGFTTGAITPYVYVSNDGSPAPKLLSHAKIQYRDMPVVEIPGYTTGRIDFVNLDDVKKELLNGASTPFSNGGDDLDPTGIRRVGDVVQFMLYCWVQLRLRNPKHNAFSIQDLS